MTVFSQSFSETGDLPAQVELSIGGTLPVTPGVSVSTSSPGATGAPGVTGASSTPAPISGTSSSSVLTEAAAKLLVPGLSVPGSTGASTGAVTAGSDGWNSTQFQFSPIGKDTKKLLDKSSRVMHRAVGMADTLMKIVDLVMQIVNALQTDFTNIYKVLQILAKLLLTQLQEALIATASSGIYFLPVTPDMSSLNSVFSPGGGFNGVMDKVNRKLFDTKDPNRPIFPGANDYVGGLLVVLTTGSNVGDLVNNLDKLGRIAGDLIGGTSSSNPPEAVKATPCLRQKLGVGPKLPAVELEWNNPKDTYNVDSYLVHRSRTKLGTPVLDSNGAPLVTLKLSDGTGGDPVTVYNDPSFNGGNPKLVKVSYLRKGLKFVDYDVNEGTTYYYRVSPMFPSSEEGYLVEGRTLSRTAETTVVTCIPDTLLTSLITETPDGFMVGTNRGDAPDWHSTTMRSFLGADIDRLFKEMVGFTEGLLGFAETSSDHFELQLDNIKGFIASAKAFLATLDSLIAALESLKFSGGAMVLPLEPKKTGLQGLSKRISSATMSGPLKKYIADNSDTCSTAFAMLIVVGCPSGDSFTSAMDLSPADKDRMNAAGTFNNATQAYAEAKAASDKFIASNSFTKGVSEDAVRISFNFLSGIFGG